MNRWAQWLQTNGPGRFQLASKVGWDAFVNTAARQPLEQLTRAQMTALTEDELEDYTEARMVWNANLPTGVRQAGSSPRLLANRHVGAGTMSGLGRVRPWDETPMGGRVPQSDVSEVSEVFRWLS